MAEKIRVERDGEIATIRLNRPEVLNAFDLEMVTLLLAQLRELAADDRVGALLLTGAGRAFCAGADLKWALSTPRDLSETIRQLVAQFHPAVTLIRRMPKPVIAAVNGAAAGGGFSLALACDFRVMARSAVLRQVYTSHGLCLDGGGSHTLTRLVGWSRALEIAAFDPPISSEQALAWGLVSKVVEDDQALQEATGMARALAARSRHSFGCAKQLLNDSLQTPLEAQLEKEEAAIVRCATHPDGQEGVRAFLEKREAVFNRQPAL